MKYSELIHKKKQYKYSANLCFDLKNDNKIDNFIPNITTTEILGEYLYGIIEGGNVHSRILYGSYGTGKSHLLTVICAILGHINVIGKGFEKFIESIDKYNKELAEYITSFIKNSKPFLVVPIYSDFQEFDKCITFSLKKELNKQGLEVCFKSYFQEALNLIEKWKDRKESKERLIEVCNKHEVRLSELEQSLESFDKKSELLFDMIFKDMTYGASFTSEVGNLIDNLDAANQAIKFRYQGIIFAFDEFGRFIEDQGEGLKIKAVQDLAEYCDHSQTNNYLILVSHKQLSLYTERMRKDINDEWKKVEGRFKSTSINVKYDQCLSLISHIIPKTNNWKDFKIKYAKNLDNLYEQAWDFKGFLIPPEGGNPFEGGFPLHPITLYALDRLSKRVAQNERTFFTYLASDEEYSLFFQLKKLNTDRFHFVGLDNIYDYFETNIKAYRFDEAYEVNKKLQFAMNKLGSQSKSEIDLRVLKTIAVISIIADMSVLKPDESTLCHVIDGKETNIKRSIDRLEKLKIIKFMRQYGYYDFLDSSIYDFDSMIDERIGSVNDEMAITMLNEEFAQFVVYPHDYNVRFHMKRVFLPIFIAKEDINKRNAYRHIPEYYDGILAFVIERNYRRETYKNTNDVPERTILLVNTTVDSLLKEAKRYIAIKYFYSKKNELKKDDPTAERELAIYLNEQRSIIEEQIEKWKNLEGESYFAFVNGRKRQIGSTEKLTSVISGMMFNTFDKTIIVNNDLINKNNISGAIRTARNKAISGIISQKDIFDGCFPMSPEHSIMRSVLSKNGIHNDKTVKKLNSLKDGTNAGEPVMSAINIYLRKCEKVQYPVQELYQQLKEPPYGLRDGYIPILLAYALRKYENVALYFHGLERDYGVEELNSAINNPADYSLYLCNWQEEQKKYIGELEEIFKSSMNKEANNRLKNLYSAMNLHFVSVSKMARTTEKYVSEITKKYRDMLSVSYKDYYKFFFETLPTLEYDFQNVTTQVQNIKKDLESVVPRQVSTVKAIMREVLRIDTHNSIKEYVLNRYNESWAKKGHIHFDYYTKSMMDYIANFDEKDSEEQFVLGLTEVLSGFEIGYWNDSKINDFEKAFKNAVEQLENYEVTTTIYDGELQIIVRDAEGEKISTRFNTKTLDVNGQIMLNKLLNVIDNFGESVSYEDRLQIITELIAKI